MKRTEKDPMGEMEIDDELYYGIQTARALENFRASGHPIDIDIIHSYAMLKKACAIANRDLGRLEEDKADAVIQAANDIIMGILDDQFPVDAFQAGAGTSTNMNVNEVLASRALEILGMDKSSKDYIHPNDHVNMGQSSNDTFPTAVHMALVCASDPLLEALDGLSRSLNAKGSEFSEVLKTGRTHLMDAIPMRLGQAFRAYSCSVDRSSKRLRERIDDLMELPIGGNAVGTGAHASKGFRNKVILAVNEMTGLEFKPPRDSFEAIQSRAQLTAFSSALRELALELIRIANDIRLLGSGPTSGLGEIELPPVQPGSSIMPGKVNPSMAECMNMVCFQVVGNDATIAMASQAGQMEINVMTPVIAHSIFHSLRLFTNFIPDFTVKCIDGIMANEAKCQEHLESNPSLATLLISKIGYLASAELARECLETGVPVIELAVSKGLITKNEAREIFDMDRISKDQYE